MICNVDFYNASTKTVSMTPAEGGATREGLKAGDELVAYNMNTGAAIGEAKIAAVLQSSGAMNIRLDRGSAGAGQGLPNRPVSVQQEISWSGQLY